MAEGLTLADVLGREVRIEWYEAVALVRAVAERLLETGEGSPAVPELHQIRLVPGGEVELAGRMLTDEPVRRLGQLLQALLVHADVPVQLRLLVSESTAPAPAMASVRDYDEKLAYFERPGRSAVLAALYARVGAAAASPAPAVPAPSAPTLDMIAPLPEPEPEPVAESRAGRLRWRRRMAVAGAAVLIAAGSSAGAWYLRRARRAETRLAGYARRASDVFGSAVVSGLSAVTETVGLGRIVPGDAPPSPAPPPVEAPPAPPRRARRAEPAPRAPAPAPAFRAFDLEAQLVRPASRIPELLPAAPVPASTDGPSAEAAADADAPVYTFESEGVVPPVGVRPQLASELPPGLDRRALTEIELVILPDGSVGSVHLVGRPRSVRESMFLSAAKAWQFQPATKAGVPVKYRKTIWVALD